MGITLKNNKSKQPYFLDEMVYKMSDNKGETVEDVINYRIVASTNTCYYSENELFVQRSQ